MAMAVGLVNDGFSWTQRSSMKYRKEGKKNASCVALSANLTDQYKKLRIQPGASEREVKKAFRQLALQYHPDVCKGNNCSIQFQIISEAYDKVMSYLRGDEENTIDQYEEYDCCDTEDLWEEWMGWEGAGIRDYSSHINPYI